jgi:hypothetical protein
MKVVPECGMYVTPELNVVGASSMSEWCVDVVEVDVVCDVCGVVGVLSAQEWIKQALWGP